MAERNISIGDAVEVRFVRQDGSIEWRPAAVVGVATDHISVAFADHHRMAVRNGEWKRP